MRKLVVAVWLWSIGVVAGPSAGQIPDAVRQAVVARRADAVAVMINGRLRADGTPVDQTFIFWSETGQQQIFAQTAAGGRVEIAELPFPAGGMLPLPEQFTSLVEVGAAARKRGLVKGFEAPDNPERLLTASLTNSAEGCVWRVFGYDGSGAFDTVVVNAGAAANGSSPATPVVSNIRLPPTTENVRRVLHERIGDDAVDVLARVQGSPPVITVTGRVPHPGVKLQIRRAMERWIDSPYDSRYVDTGLTATGRWGLQGAIQPQAGDLHIPGRLQFSREGSQLMLVSNGRPPSIEVQKLTPNATAYRFALPSQSLSLQALAADGGTVAAVTAAGGNPVVQMFGPRGAIRAEVLPQRFVATAIGAGTQEATMAAVGGYVPGEGSVLVVSRAGLQPLPIQPPLGVGRCLLEFSPDGTQLAVGETETATVTIWDVAARQEIRRLAHDELSVTALAWSDDGRQLAVGSHDGDGLLLYQLGDGAVRTLSGLPGKVRHLDFAPDGTRLASAHFNVGVGVWDLSTGRLVNGLDADDAGAELVAFGDGGSCLYTGVVTASSEIRRWDLHGTAAPANNVAPRGGVTAVLGLTRRADPGGSLRLVVQYRVSDCAGRQCELSLELRNAAGQPVAARHPARRGSAGQFRAAWRFAPTENTETSYHIFVIPRGEYPAGELTAAIDLTVAGRSQLPQPHTAAVPQ